MFAKSLTLTDFRSYPFLNAEFDSNNIFITGANGSGKTNIIEALYYLTLGRSFRKADDCELIRKGSKEASIYLSFHDEKDDSDHSLSAIIGNKYKVFAYDNEKVPSLSKILGKLLVTYYDPSQVFFFQGEPSDRRKLMDEVLSQLSNEYLYSIGRYKKLIKERNSALSKNGDKDIIDVLRNELINLAYRIVTERKRAIKILSKKATEYYKTLFGTTDELTLQYKTNSPLDEDQRSFITNSLTLFDENKSLENMRGITLIGPHRDDLIAFLNRNSLAGYGSQGQNRLASLSLRLAIRDLLNEKLSHQPILLLDDVTSDLDKQRTANLLTAVGEKGQVFITGTKIPSDYHQYSIYETTDDKQLVRRNQE
ncbi:MAG: DNA replication and repair protein RecF [Bacilli bacterium]